MSIAKHHFAVLHQISQDDSGGSRDAGDAMHKHNALAIADVLYLVRQVVKVLDERLVRPIHDVYFDRFDLLEVELGYLFAHRYYACYAEFRHVRFGRPYERAQVEVIGDFS